MALKKFTLPVRGFDPTARFFGTDRFLGAGFAGRAGLRGPFLPLGIVDASATRGYVRVGDRRGPGFCGQQLLSQEMAPLLALTHPLGGSRLLRTRGGGGLQPLEPGLTQPGGRSVAIFPPLHPQIIAALRMQSSPQPWPPEPKWLAKTGAM